MGRPVMDLEKRFWKFVKKTDSCWLWIGRHDQFGYGVLSVTVSLNKRKTRRAHRLSYKINVEEIPKGRFVLHRCDVPACVNPEHLYLGDQADNIKDIVSRNRQGSRDNCSRGEQSHLAVISKADVVELRSRCKSGQSVKKAWKEMNLPITVGGARRIVANKCWRHL